MGERFGNYEIIRKLAAGGMAEVLLAKQRSMGGFERLVCLKRILPHLSAQEDFLKMFQDEARIAANLVHPNIAQIYDINQEGENYYIAMEYVRGEDLRRVYNQEVQRGTTIPRHIAAQVVMGAAAGLDYAHRHAALDGTPLGIVHRDVSPQNMLVTYDGHVKLIDFGVAKAAGKLIETRSGVLKGKYSYMSPEQASGDPVDGRCDIFAMGITLYEITTGTRLFKRENELETLHAVIACNVTPPSDIVPRYDRGLEAIVLKALAYDPDDRYHTAGEMERDLEKYLLDQRQPTSAANLAEYMHDLFAEKLADEALFGGPPWNETSGKRLTGEPATASNKKKPSKNDTTEEVMQELDEAAPEHTIVDEMPQKPRTEPDDDEWGTEDEHLEKTESNLHINVTQHNYHPESSSVTSAPASPPLAPEPDESESDEGSLEPAPSPDTPVVDEPPSPPPPRRGLQSWQLRLGVALGVMLLVSGVWFYRKKHHPNPADQAGTPTPAPTVAAAPEAPAEPPIDPEDPHAYLSVVAPIPMEVTLGNRYLGDTPLRRLPMEPGSYRLKLESKNEGLTIRRSVRLEAGGPSAVEVLPQKGILAVTGRPWAWVQVGLKPATETPVQFELLEGEYSIVFECPDGHRKAEQVRVLAGNTANAGINCGK